MQRDTETNMVQRCRAKYSSFFRTCATFIEQHRETRRWIQTSLQRRHGSETITDHQKVHIHRDKVHFQHLKPSQNIILFTFNRRASSTQLTSSHQRVWKCRSSGCLNSNVKVNLDQSARFVIGHSLVSHG